MAVSVSIVKKWSVGSLKARTVDVTGDSSQASGGEALAPSTVKLEKIVAAVCSPWRVSTNATAYLCEYDVPNNKILAFKGDTTNPDAQASTANLSTYTARVTFLGY